MLGTGNSTTAHPWEVKGINLTTICFSYDAVFAAGPAEILKKFLAFKARVVISAEDFIWPDKSLLVCTIIMSNIS